MRQNEVQRETRRKEKLEKEVKQLQTDLESKQAEIKSLTQQSQRLQDDQQKLEQQLQEHKVRDSDLVGGVTPTSITNQSVVG